MTLPHRGGVVLEITGCAVALIGGLILGSLYYGINVKEVTVKALQHAEIMAPNAKPAGDPAAVSVDVHQAIGAALDGKAQTAGSTETAARPPTALADALALPAAERHALTLAYWNALDECMKNELAGRNAANAKSTDLEVYDYLTLRNQGPPKQRKAAAPRPLKTTPRSKNWALYEYLTLRRKGHQAAAEAIEKLDTRGVDGHISSYAEKALAWHTEGAELFRRALDLLTDAPSAQLSGPFAQAWQSKATQHQMEERLLAEKHLAVQSYLDHGNYSGDSDAAP
jgi:hypothetical protein